MNATSYLDSVFLISSGLATSMISLNEFWKHKTIELSQYGITMMAGIGSVYMTDLTRDYFSISSKVGLTVLFVLILFLNYVKMIRVDQETIENELIDEISKLDITKLNSVEKNLYLNGIEPDRAYKELLNNQQFERLEQIRIIRQLEPQHEWMGCIIRNSVRKINNLRRFYDIYEDKEEEEGYRY